MTIAIVILLAIEVTWMIYRDTHFLNVREEYQRNTKTVERNIDIATRDAKFWRDTALAYKAEVEKAKESK